MIKEVAVNQGPGAKTLLEAYRELMDSIRYRRYRVNPARSVLEIGDAVRPETVIGFHYETGRPVTAELEGRVVRILFSPRDESVMMLAVYRQDSKLCL